jgi:hypothetical protein
MRALDTRNEIAHTYRQKAFEKAIRHIKEEYFQLFDELHRFLKLKSDD